ncbi:hypothetical protein LLH00_05090 [bacterium]|nr:hypothetical protein [bacterium]
MRFKPTVAHYLVVGLSVLLLSGGCFSLSIPFLTKGGPSDDLKPTEREFPRDNVFIGYDGDGKPIVELRLVKQEVSKDGLVITTRLFPTENFKVRNIFRGLRSINYYPIERRFHRLELKYGKRKLKAKVKTNLEVRDQKPLDALFEKSGVFHLLPDTIDMAELKFQDVKRWGRMSEQNLAEWYEDKENYLEELDRRQRRSDLVESYRRRMKRDYTQTFSQYDSLYVTTNNTYVYLEKDVNSDILFVMNTGDRIDYGVSDGLWVEVPLEGEQIKTYTPMLEARRQKALVRWRQQRQAARSGRRTPTAAPSGPGGAGGAETEQDTTFKNTAYVLDVMVQPSYRQAVAWETETMQTPADVPLFAQVLQDREKERLARLDSIAKAYTDSLTRIKAREDSLARAQFVKDSTATAVRDSLAAAKKVPAVAGDSLGAAGKAAATPQQAKAGADSSAAAKPVPAKPAVAHPDSAHHPAADSVRSGAPPPSPAAQSAHKDTSAVKPKADSTSAPPPAVAGPAAALPAAADTSAAPPPSSSP